MENYSRLNCSLIFSIALIEHRSECGVPFLIKRTARWIWIDTLIGKVNTARHPFPKRCIDPAANSSCYRCSYTRLIRTIFCQTKTASKNRRHHLHPHRAAGISSRDYHPFLRRTQTVQYLHHITHGKAYAFHSSPHIMCTGAANRHSKHKPSQGLVHMRRTLPIEIRKKDWLYRFIKHIFHLVIDRLPRLSRIKQTCQILERCPGSQHCAQLVPAILFHIAESMRIQGGIDPRFSGV